MGELVKLYDKIIMFINFEIDMMIIKFSCFINFIIKQCIISPDLKNYQLIVTIKLQIDS